MNEEIRGNNAALISAMERVLPGVSHKIGTIDGQEVTVMELPGENGGRTLHSLKKHLDEYRTNPQYRAGTATFQTLESLVDHANRFKDAGSALFANQNMADPSLTCVLDYLPEGADSGARHGRHRGLYKFPLSQPWVTWTSKNRTAMSLQDFVDFVDENIVNVADPDALSPEVRQILVDRLELKISTASELLSAGRNLSLHVDHHVAQKYNPTTGARELRFSEEHSDGNGQPVKVPNAFLLSLPLFHNGEFCVLGAQLKYRVKGEKVEFLYQLVDVDRVYDRMFEAAANKARDATGLPLFYGLPEK